MAKAFAHIELSTPDTSAAKAFYKTVFGWKMKDDGGYSMIDTGGATSGGITKPEMPGQPTAWMPYVEVPDVRAAVAKAQAAGAKVYVEFQDIGPMGSIGVFADPTGATIGVWTKSKVKAKAKKKPAKKAAKRKKR